MSKDSAVSTTDSAMEFFILAVKYAKERGLRSIPLPIDIAQSVLDVALPNHSQDPPPLEVTSVSYEEEQRRTLPLRTLADRPGYVGIWKKAKAPSNNSRKALKDAGRGWHQGM